VPHVQRAIHACLAVAVRKGRLASNPSDGATIPCAAPPRLTRSRPGS
jgi:hypothetical protein